MDSGFLYYVGVDWGSELHQICVTDALGEVIDEWTAAHSGKGINGLADRLVELSDGMPEHIAVAIEVPFGPIVETLAERGNAVFSINPKQLDRFRDRYSPAGAKDDRRDALVLAHSLRTDTARFRRVHLSDPEIIELRELARIDDELVEERRRLANRLRAQLHRYYPQVLELSSSVDEPWIWDLLDAAPTPERARWLHRKRVARILQKNQIRRVSLDEVWSTLKAPPVHVAPGTAEAAAAHVALLIPRQRLVHKQLKDVRKRTAQKLDQLREHGSKRGEHHDVDIVLSVPGIGTKVAAIVLAEASQALSQRDYHTLRILAGVAPVTSASGKSRRVSMRYARNKRLANAVFHWARVASQKEPAAKAHYAAMRRRGHTHQRALRQLSDRLLRMLIAMLRDGTLFESDRSNPPADTQIAA